MQSLRKCLWLVLWMKLFLKGWFSAGKEVGRGKGKQVFVVHGGRQRGDMSIFGRSLPPDAMALGVPPPSSAGSLQRAGCVGTGKACVAHAVGTGKAGCVGKGKACVAHAVGRAAGLASLTSTTLIE